MKDKPKEIALIKGGHFISSLESGHDGLVLIDYFLDGIIIASASKSDKIYFDVYSNIMVECLFEIMKNLNKKFPGGEIEIETYK